MPAPLRMEDAVAFRNAHCFDLQARGATGGAGTIGLELEDSSPRCPSAVVAALQLRHRCFGSVIHFPFGVG